MIQPIKKDTIVFKNKTPMLKKLYNANLIPIKKGIYGFDLVDTIVINGKTYHQDLGSLEHLLPKSKGGLDTFANNAICRSSINSIRGNKPIATVFNANAFDEYCENMKKIKVYNVFDGKRYVQDIINTVHDLLNRGL